MKQKTIEQGRGRSRQRELIEITQATSQNVEAHSNTKVWAEISEVVMAESMEEKQLWKERAQMEKRIERKEKMIYNARERLKSGWVLDETQALNDEIDETQAEIDMTREEITAVDSLLFKKMLTHSGYLSMSYYWQAYSLLKCTHFDVDTPILLQQMELLREPEPGYPI